MLVIKVGCMGVWFMNEFRFFIRDYIVGIFGKVYYEWYREVVGKYESF